MTSKRELILQAVASSLTGTVGVGTRIYRSRLEAFQRAEAPAIVIEPGPDNAAVPAASNCHIDWSLTLLVAIYTRGQQPEVLADPIICDVHQRLMTDRSLGGVAMDVWPIAVDPQFEKADKPALWSVLTFKVRYRTNVSLIEP